MKLNVLLLQMDVEFGNPENNFKKLKMKIEEISPKQNTLVVLPELFLTGYHRASIELIAKKFENGKIIEDLKEICKDYSILIYGSIPQKEGDKTYNTAILISENELIGKYNKSHLFGPMGEKQLFDRGNNIVIKEVDEFSFGLSICYDLRFPELYQKQAKLGANIILICAEWPIKRIKHWTALAKARAIENQCFVIAVNRVGKDPKYTYGGHSVIFSPFGEIIASIDHADEAVIEGILDLNEVTNFRKRFDVRGDKWISL